MATHQNAERCLAADVSALPRYEPAEGPTNWLQFSNTRLSSFEPEALQPLILNRQEHRDFLYDEGSERFNGIQTALASLTLQTSPRAVARVKGYGGKSQQIELAEAVNAILAKHDSLGREGDTAGCFSLKDTWRDLPVLSHITASTICRWVRICKHHGIPSPFRKLPVFDIQRSDFYRADVQLVIETASVVVEALQNGYQANRKNVRSPKNLEMANFIARRGPQFANAWANGTAALDYCAKHGLAAEEWHPPVGPQENVGNCEY
jgi:hypothetical protein